MTNHAIARAPNMKNSKNVRFMFENKTMKPVTVDGKKLLSMTLSGIFLALLALMKEQSN